VFSIMPEKADNEPPAASTGYRISNGPVVRFARSDPKLPNDLPEVIELPRVYGAPLLFAIARDPHTLFAYWISKIPLQWIDKFIFAFIETMVQKKLAKRSSRWRATVT
jgi:hypothetical protein